MGTRLELKAYGFDIICVNVFLPPPLNEIPANKKKVNFIPTILLVLAMFFATEMSDISSGTGATLPAIYNPPLGIRNILSVT